MPQSNPFLSMESDLDANNNNPVLNAEDPAKAAEEAAETKPDDFEVIQPETIEGENVKESDVIFEGEVEEKLKEADNIVKESANTGDALQALASVAQEMHQIIAQHGKLSVADMMIAQGVVDSCESLVPSIKDTETQMPSMENFKTVGMQYTSSQVSLESVMDKIATAFNNLGLNVERLFENGVGLARSMTPIIDSQIARVTKVRGQINNANRDAGQKELSGKFVKNLTVEGRAPDAATTVKTAAYLNQAMAELLSDKVQNSAVNYVKSAQGVIREAMSGDLKSPSALLAFALKVLMPAGNLGAVLSQAHDQYLSDKVAKQIKIDGKIAPELFTMFPSIAKIRDSRQDAKYVESCRSLPLFGNKAIFVTQYKKEVSADLRYHLTPEVTLAPLGVGKGKTIQALTAAQQADVLDSVLQMLQTSREYFKNYAARNKACMTVWQQAFKLTLELEKTKKGFSNSIARTVCIALVKFYTRMYWEGIFQHQAKIAIYGRRTATALIDFVEASSAAAQGGSPSQESLPVEAVVEANPFLA